ncbi:MAG: hypothetical protein F6K08_31950 [Okeania sp. SIO1H6]|nr:hypothetical protein [Okeania sp. SIO1H6]
MAQTDRVIQPEPEVSGKLEVLPKGIINWECDPTEQVLSGIRWNNSVNYEIQLDNYSNWTVQSFCIHKTVGFM